jgi:hypothetical protein
MALALRYRICRLKRYLRLKGRRGDMRSKTTFFYILWLLLAASFLMGCRGGGNKNIPINPSPTNGNNNSGQQTQVNANIVANPDRLYSEEETILSITTQGEKPINVSLKQNPQIPQDRFTIINRQ